MDVAGDPGRQIGQEIERRAPDLIEGDAAAQRRVQNVKDVVKEGDKVKVKLLGFDERGKVRLSMKVVDQTTGEDLEAKQKAEGEQQPPREAAAGRE